MRSYMLVAFVTLAVTLQQAQSASLGENAGGLSVNVAGDGQGHGEGAAGKDGLSLGGEGGLAVKAEGGQGLAVKAEGGVGGEEVAAAGLEGENVAEGELAVKAEKAQELGLDEALHVEGGSGKVKLDAHGEAEVAKAIIAAIKEAIVEVEDAEAAAEGGVKVKLGHEHAEEEHLEREHAEEHLEGEHAEGEEHAEAEGHEKDAGEGDAIQPHPEEPLPEEELEAVGAVRAEGEHASEDEEPLNEAIKSDHELEASENGEEAAEGGLKVGGHLGNDAERDGEAGLAGELSVGAGDEAKAEGGLAAGANLVAEGAEGLAGAAKGVIDGAAAGLGALAEGAAEAAGGLESERSLNVQMGGPKKPRQD